MGAPFSTNLRRMQARRSTGGAGADYADEAIAREVRSRPRDIIDAKLQFWERFFFVLAACGVAGFVATLIT